MKTTTLWWVYSGVLAVFGGLQLLWVALQVTNDAHKSWWVVFFPSYIAFGLILITSFGFSTQHKTIKSVFTHRKLVRYGLISISIFTVVMLIIWLDESSPNWTTFWICETAVMFGGCLGLCILVIYDAIKQRTKQNHFRRKHNFRRAARRRRWWVITLVGAGLIALQSLLITIGVDNNSTGAVWGSYAIPTIVFFAITFAFFGLYKTFFQRSDVSRIWISQRQVVRMSMLIAYFITGIFILVKQSGSTAFSWGTVWIIGAIMALSHACVFIIMYSICECRISVQGDGPVLDVKMIPNHSPPIDFIRSDGMD